MTARSWYYVTMTRDEILKRLHENLDKIRAFGTSSVGLFGSFAGGNPSQDSDVDLVIADSLKPGIREEVLRTVIYAA